MHVAVWLECVLSLPFLSFLYLWFLFYDLVFSLFELFFVKVVSLLGVSTQRAAGCILVCLV